MRRVVVVMQTTLNSRIARSTGVFWEPFTWGQPEQAWLNDVFRRADTWAMSRVMYDIIVPWWDQVAAGNPPADAGELQPADLEFAGIQAGMLKLVFSRTLGPGEKRQIMKGDLSRLLMAAKTDAGRDIILSCGPGTLAPLAATPGLIDEYIVAVHPFVLGSGIGMFSEPGTDLALRLLEIRSFASGTVVLRYEPAEVRP
jgi:dihydrofolate reductase